ncbi:MAG: GNAT family N-acetyltransferase [Rickettsiales bacterium]|nr:GNAT family N-acetyltransferase [Rickettsiales bacterium]
MSTDDLTITTATPDEFPDIWPFFRDILAEGMTYAYPRDVTLEQGCAIWFERGRHVFIVRDTQGKVLGTCYLRANREGPASHVANAGFMVAPEARGKGLARRMGEFIIEQARTQGFLALQFNFVVSTNAIAVRAWQSIGMSIIGTIPEGYQLPDGRFVDALIMHRKL